MVVDIHQVVGKVGKLLCQRTNNALFKLHIVGERAHIFRNIAAKLLGKRAARVSAGVARRKSNPNSLSLAFFG